MSESAPMSTRSALRKSPMYEPVIMLQYDAPVLHGTRTGVEGKRAQYWRNRPRNQFIADLATHLVQRPNQTVEALGLDRRILGNHPQQRIAILVESLEHAYEVANLAPGWVIHDRRIHDFEPPDEAYDPTCTPTGIIVTLVYYGMNGTNADVIIRATGGYGVLSDIPQGGDCGVPWQEPRLLIDIADHLEGRPTPDTVRRHQEYNAEERDVSHAMPAAVLRQRPIPRPTSDGSTSVRPRRGGG